MKPATFRRQRCQPHNRIGFVEEKYGVLLDGLYGGKTVQHIDTKVKFEDGRSGSIAADLKLSDAKRYPAVTKAAA